MDWQKYPGAFQSDGRSKFNQNTCMPSGSLASEKEM